jgi:hypothetical protein
MNGCLIANSAIQTGREHFLIAAHVKRLVDKNQDLFSERIERGKKENDVPVELDSRATAAYVNGLLQAMALAARVQQSPEAISAIASMGTLTLSILLCGNCTLPTVSAK